MDHQNVGEPREPIPEMTDEYLEEEQSAEEAKEAKQRRNERLLKLLIGIAVAIAVVAVAVRFLLPRQNGWSEWMEQLPLYAWFGDYELEWRTAYKSRQMEYCWSTTESRKSGWERYAVEDVGPWSDWSTTPASPTQTREVESRTLCRYPIWETMQSTSPEVSGWTLYDTAYDGTDYCAWSEWTDGLVEAGEGREVESKLCYRSRTVTYSPWSDWQNSPVSPSADVRVESRTLFAYYYFYCLRCGDDYRYPYWGVYPCDRCGGKINASSETVVYYEAPHSNSKPWRDTPRLCQYINGKVCWNFTNEDHPGIPEWKYQYRYATRLDGSGETGVWSSWQDTPITAQYGLEVESRTFYRYRERGKVYLFRRSAGWSDWVEAAPLDVPASEVETAVCYRHRDTTLTTYYFRRWGEWSDCTTTPIPQSDGVQVKEVKQYHYRSK